jgi:hypothetical protein
MLKPIPSAPPLMMAVFPVNRDIHVLPDNRYYYRPIAAEFANGKRKT